MGLYSLPVSMALGIVIILAELLRNKRGRGIDLLRAINVLYFIVFCIAPIFLMLTDLSQIKEKRWLLNITFNNTAFFYASVLSFGGYIIILCAYNLRLTWVHTADSIIKRDIETSITCEKDLFCWGSLFFSIGLISLLFYIVSVGGIWTALENGSRFRSGLGSAENKAAFLKYLTPFMVVASYYFWALTRKTRKNKKSWQSICYRSLFYASILLSLFILYHNAGRLSLAAYLLVFLIATKILTGKINPLFVIAGLCICLVIIISGDNLFTLFRTDKPVIFEQQYLPRDHLIGFLLEFSFPFVNLANAYLQLGDGIDIRYFIDLPLSLLYMLPERLIGLHLPDTLSDLNSYSFRSSGTVPVDLLSFGYYSFGISGVIISCFAFGLLSRYLEESFSFYKNEPLLVIFKAAWLIRIAFAVMYGDPQLFLKQNFSLLAATLIVVFRDKKKKAKPPC